MRPMFVWSPRLACLAALESASLCHRHGLLELTVPPSSPLLLRTRPLRTRPSTSRPTVLDRPLPSMDARQTHPGPYTAHPNQQQNHQQNHHANNRPPVSRGTAYSPVHVPFAVESARRDPFFTHHASRGSYGAPGPDNAQPGERQGGWGANSGTLRLSLLNGNARSRRHSFCASPSRVATRRTRRRCIAQLRRGLTDKRHC